MKRMTITWPVALVLTAFLAVVGATLIWAPADTVRWAVSGEGLVAVLIAAYLRSPRDVAGPSVALLGVALGGSLLVGCGASQQVRTAYGDETLRCMENADEIRDREGTSAEEDAAALAAEEARCAAALMAIENGGE